MLRVDESIRICLKFLMKNILNGTDWIGHTAIYKAREIVRNWKKGNSQNEELTDRRTGKTKIYASVTLEKDGIFNQIGAVYTVEFYLPRPSLETLYANAEDAIMEALDSTDAEIVQIDFMEEEECLKKFDIDNGESVLSRWFTK